MRVQELRLEWDADNGWINLSAGGNGPFCS